ncbi:MAG: DUF2970 domain-containing protein [Rhodocyclaceae bacterium]|nr:DUF2970 domain-containing protein [Rhodocyclaceae bacterium]
MEPTNHPNGRSGLSGLIRTVASGMFGIRGRAAHERDATSLSPVQIILTAAVFMLIFVSVIVTIATLVASK